MSQIALRLTEIVRLGEPLPGQQAIGDLRLAATGVGVVERRPARRPLEELAPLERRCIAQRLAQASIPLWVDDDGGESPFDGADGHQRLGDGLARTRRADDQRVPPGVLPEGNRDLAPVRAPPEKDLPAVAGSRAEPGAADGQRTCIERFDPHLRRET